MVSPTPAVPSARLKQRWLDLAPPAPLKATLANVAHLETGMIIPADDEEVAKMMCRPYTSVGSTNFNESCSQFSFRPSTSLYSGQSRCSSRSWRKFNSPSMACGLRSPTPSTRDSRGYESLEQLLTPTWRSSTDLGTATPGATERATGSRGRAPVVTPARQRSVRGTPCNTGESESPPATPGTSLWAKAQKAKVLLAMPQKPSTAPAAPNGRLGSIRPNLRHNAFKVEQLQEDGGSATASSSSSDSEDSVDPVLQKTIGNLLPGKSLWGAAISTAQSASKQNHLLRRTGLDEDMMEIARFAAAAQQAVLREEEEMNMPTQVLPGVYFGHMEPPNLGRLPTSRRISHLQQVEQRKIREDTVEQRDRYQISDEDVLLPPPLDPRLAGIQSAMPMPLPPRRDSSSIKPRSTAHRKAAVATWDAIKEVSEQKVLSKEEQDRLKEEKVAYDDWRRQVMVCTRLLNTHINRFETDPVKAGPQYVF